MPSQFFGLQIGASGLATYQAALNTTANNAANVQTEGYTRQTAVIEAKDPLRVHAKYGSAGTGVSVTEIIQERDLYYDTKYWQNSSSSGYYSQKLYYLNQIETLFRDDEQSQKGFTTIFSEMFNALDTLKTRAEEPEVRNQFINQAESLCTYFKSLSTELTSIQDDCNEEIKSTVDNINSISEKVAMLNKQIYAIEVRGGHANELRDQRALLIDELSGIVDVETKEFDVHNSYGQDLGGTNYRVYINGHILVDGNEHRSLSCVSSEYSLNQTDAPGMYNIVWADTGMDFPTTGGNAGGTLRGLFDVRDGNNADNLKGYGTQVTEGTRDDGTKFSKLTMDTLSLKDINKLAIPDEGRITINNKHFYYDSWEAKVNADGTLESVTFNLTEEMSAADAAAVAGNRVVCGETVDAYGVPYYQAQINEFLRSFMQTFNDIEKKGVDLNGNQMGTFFMATSKAGTEYDASDWDTNMATQADFTIKSGEDSYYNYTAQTVHVNKTSLKDRGYFATASEINNGVAKYDIVEKLLTLQKDVKMFRGDSAQSFLETLLSDITVDVNKNNICAKNYSNMLTVIAQQRTSVSGVDDDEEALNLIKFQNAYNLSSKVISVMSEIYNKLINETGVV